MMIAVDVGAVNMGRCIENKLRGIVDVVKTRQYDLCDRIREKQDKSHLFDKCLQVVPPLACP